MQQPRKKIDLHFVEHLPASRHSSDPFRIPILFSFLFLIMHTLTTVIAVIRATAATTGRRYRYFQ
jgi:hypothetical protein